MGKNVFRSGEVQFKQHKVFLRPPEPAGPRKGLPVPVQEIESLEPMEEYTGPTADQLRREAEQFKAQWETEKQAMIDEARAEADKIVQEAEEEAFRQIREKTEQASQAKRDAEEESERSRAASEAEHQRIMAEAQEEALRLKEEARRKGYEEGREEGIEAGKEEARRVIERFHVVLSKAIERRNEIIAESEGQVINLVLSIAKKVIKVISENQKNVVINNIVQSLKRLQHKSEVIVRVNLADIDIATRHKADILKTAERVENITIAEDSTVDPGGCIIETDFGEIDARISSQLREIEDRILEITPIKARPKTGTPAGAG
jgi:flagellar assembly protein FliH